jgi:hypothetical protein
MSTAATPNLLQKLKNAQDIYGYGHHGEIPNDDASASLVG